MRKFVGIIGAGMISTVTCSFTQILSVMLRNLVLRQK